MPRSIDELPDASFQRLARLHLPPPAEINDVHLIDICGTDMGAQCPL